MTLIEVPRAPWPQPPPTALRDDRYDDIRRVLGYWWDRLSTQERYTLYDLAKQHYGAETQSRASR